MRRLAMIALLPLAACGGGITFAQEDDGGERIAATGSGAARDFRVEGFTGVDLRGPDDIEVRSGATFAVHAEGTGAALDDLRVTKHGNVLRIGRKSRLFQSSNGEPLRITVTLPRLASASIAGSGDMRIDKAEGNFSGAIAGSGNMGIAALKGDDVDLSIAGAGDLSVAGSARRAKLSIAGTGDVQAKGFRAASADISIAGTGSVFAQVSGEASVSIVGTGDVELTGGAKCSVSRVGTGDVRCS